MSFFLKSDLQVAVNETIFPLLDCLQTVSVAGSLEGDLRGRVEITNSAHKPQLPICHSKDLVSYPLYRLLRTSLKISQENLVVHRGDTI